MKCIVVGGFLGSGKTTLINYLLKRTAEAFPGTGTALLINEFGEIAVDSAVIEAGSYSICEITGGCVCCTLRGMLADAVADIKERENPDLLIIEATGLAVPSEIAVSAGAAGGEAVYSLLCVDPEQYLKLAGRLAIYDRQLASADAVMLTKKDVRDEGSFNKAGAGLLAENPARTCFGELSRMSDYLFSDIIGCGKQPGPEADEHMHVHDDASLPDICEVTFKLNGPVEIEKLGGDLAAISRTSGESLYRIKGIVESAEGWKAVQFTDGLMSGQPVEEPVNGESFIVFIGKCEIIGEIRL